MRRFLVILAGLGITMTSFGCRHTGGKCDCIQPVGPCCKYGLYASDQPVMKPVGHIESVPAPVPVREKINQPRE